MDPDSSPDLPPLKRGTYDIEAILAAAENAEFAIPPPPRSRIANSFEPSSSFSSAYDTTITPATVAAASRNNNKKTPSTSGGNSAATTPTSTRIGARRGTVTRVSPSASTSSSPQTAGGGGAPNPQRIDLEPISDHTRGSPASTMVEDMNNNNQFQAEENSVRTTSRFQSRRAAANNSSAASTARMSNRSSPLLKGAMSPSGPYAHLEEPTPLQRALSPLNPRSRRGSIGGGKSGGVTDSSFAFSSPSSSRPGSRPESRGSYALRSHDLSNDSLLSFNVMLEQDGLDDEEDHHHRLSAAAVANGSSNRLPFFLSDPEHIKMLEGEIEDPFSPNSSSLMDDHDPMLLREQLAAVAGGSSLTSPLGSSSSRRGLSRGQSPRRSQRRMLQQQLQQHQLAQQLQHQQHNQEQQQQRSFRSNDSDNSRGSDRFYTDTNGFLSPEQGPTRHHDHNNSSNNHSNNVSHYNTSYDSSPHSLNDGEPGSGGGGGGGSNGSFSESSHQGDMSGVMSASERRKLARLERRKKLLDSIKTSADPLETVSSLAVASPTSPPDETQDMRGGGGSGLGLSNNQFNNHHPHHHQDQPWYSHEQQMHLQDEYNTSSHHDGSFHHSFDQSPNHSMDHHLHHHHHGYAYEGMDDLHHNSGFHLADSSPYHGPGGNDSHDMEEARTTSFAEWMSASADISRLDLKSPESRATSPLGGTMGANGMASLNAVTAAASAASSSNLSGRGNAGGSSGGVGVDETGGGMLPISTVSTPGVGNILLSPAFSSESAPITGSSPVFQSLQSDSSLHPSSTPMAPSVLTSSFSPALSPDVNTNLGGGNQVQPLPPSSTPLGSSGLFPHHQAPSNSSGSGVISVSALGINSTGATAGIRASGLSSNSDISNKLSPPGAETSPSSMTPVVESAGAASRGSGSVPSEEVLPNSDSSVLKTVEMSFEAKEQVAANADQKPTSGRARTPSTATPATAGANADGDAKNKATLAELALPTSSNDDGDDSTKPSSQDAAVNPLEDITISATGSEEAVGKKETEPESPTSATTLSPTGKSVASTKSSESGGGSIIRRPSGLLVSARIRDSTNLDAPRYSIREMEEMKKNVRMDLRIEITNEIREEYEKTAEQEAALFQFEIQQLKSALEKEQHEKAQLKAVLDEFEASLEDIALNTTKELGTIKEENTRLTEEKEEVEKSFVLLKTRYDELISHNDKHVENERVLRNAIEALKLDYENAESRYEKIKTHAETKMSEAQVELEAMRMMYEQEITMMRTTFLQQQQQMTQQHQIEKRELEMKLEAKTRENEELIQFSEELIAKLG